MKKKGKTYPNGEKLQGEFDTFVKESIKYIIEDKIARYQRHREKVVLVNLDDYEDIAAPERTPDIEKIGVAIGESTLFLDEEYLAEGIMQELDEKHRRILDYVFVMDLPEKAVGELMNLKEKTIFNYKYEALGILRKYMEDHGHGR